MSEKQYIVFSLDEEEYGIDITLVQEIIKLPKVTKLPNTPSYILGITNLRDKVLPLMDLRKRFNLMQAQDTEDTRMIIIKENDNIFGVKVDAVLEVLCIDDNVIETSQEISSGIDRAFIHGVGKLDDRLIIILDLTNII